MSTLSFIGEFPILRHTLDLGGYHPDLEGNSVEVWLNLSDDFQERWREYNAGVAAQMQGVITENDAAMDELFAELGDEIHGTTTDHLRQNWSSFVERVSELARARSSAPLTDALKRTRVELFTEMWDLDAADVETLFEETKAAGVRAWMRRRTWELIEQYASGRGEADGS